MKTPPSVVLMTIVLLGSLCVGCAASRPDRPTLSPKFYGVWTNVNPDFYNWWEITADGAINYGIALDGGRCGGHAAVVLNSENIDVRFGNAGAVHLHINKDGLLIFSAANMMAVHKKVKESSICQKSDGTYFEAAPHISSSK